MTQHAFTPNTSVDVRSTLLKRFVEHTVVIDFPHPALFAAQLARAFATSDRFLSTVARRSSPSHSSDIL
jgi:hypothetical protein